MITAQTMFELTQSELPCIDKILMAVKNKRYHVDIYHLNVNEIIKLEKFGFKVKVNPVSFHNPSMHRISWNAPTK